MAFTSFSRAFSVCCSDKGNFVNINIVGAFCVDSERSKILTACLDFSDVDQAFLDKYGVKLNNAIMCEEKDLPVFEDLVANKSPLYIAGGATQNTARVAQWQTNSAGAVTYAGSIGKDKFGKQLKDAADADGLTTLYMEQDTAATGTCAVLVVNGERSLMANLAAANDYKISWTQSAPVTAAIEAAEMYYIAGFVLTHSVDSIMHVCKHSDAKGKVNEAASSNTHTRTERLCADHSKRNNQV